MDRALKYSASSYTSLSQNKLHSFALNHALSIYLSDSIYTYIPKNACSTMRLSLALANGCIESEDDFEWIHQNNTTFLANLSELLKAKYTFVILRCPYTRIASLFLDKIISKDRVVWSYYDSFSKPIQLDSVSFLWFLNSLKNKKVFAANHHWRPQSEFLIYKKYDDYFCLENIPDMATRLKEKIGFNLVDARDKTLHGLDNHEKLDDECYALTKSLSLYRMKRSGKIPSYKALYNEECIALVKELYEQDIALYAEQFGTDNLLF